MKSFLRLVFFTFFICFIGLTAILIVFGSDNYPVVSQNKGLSFDNIKKVKQIIKDNRPTKLSKKRLKKLSLAETDLNLLLSYAISHGVDTKYLFARTELTDNNLKGFLTIQLPWGIFGSKTSGPKTSGRYLNLKISVKPKKNFLELDTCHIGRIKIPNLIRIPIITVFHTLLLKTDLYESLWQNAQSIEKVAIKQKTITFFYTINYSDLRSLQEKGRSFLLTDDHRQKLIEYHNHLSGIARTNRLKKNAVIDLIKGIFAFAEKNSKTGGNPILENTVALQVLSLYTIGYRLDRILEKTYQKEIKYAIRTRLLFHNRNDLPKHFLASAAIAVSTGSKFAGLVGIAKEINDSESGSGFSFADLAADKAGVKFGELAIASTRQAILFQKKIGLIQNENEIMPSISNLPEGIMELEFKKKYTDLGSAAYNLIDMEIGRRLSQCHFYKES